jgi:chromosome segregation ATPase
MNLLGKLLICFVVVMSVLMMTFGLVVNRTHRDLRAEAELLQNQVNEARTRYEDETTGLLLRHKRLDEQLRREQEAALSQLVKLEREYVALRQRNDQLHQELEELKLQRAEVTAQVAEIQDQNNQLGEQATALRADIDENLAARQMAFDQSLQATEQLHQLQGRLEATLERRRDLQQDLGQEQ